MLLMKTERRRAFCCAHGGGTSDTPWTFHQWAGAPLSAFRRLHGPVDAGGVVVGALPADFLRPVACAAAASENRISMRITWIRRRNPTKSFIFHGSFKSSLRPRRTNFFSTSVVNPLFSTFDVSVGKILGWLSLDATPPGGVKTILPLLMWMK